MEKTEKVDYETFMQMLEELNRYIAEEYDQDYILEIRAIGGFSMMVHARIGEIDTTRNKSRDIDSLTLDYPEVILAKIKEIGNKYHATDSDGWLNNHWNQTRHYNDEFAYFVRWQELDDANFSNIRVYYANLEALFMFKIRSMDNKIELAHMMPRQQDVADVASILKAFNITDLDHITNQEIAVTVPYFPYAVNYLIENGIVKGTKLETQNNQKLEDSETGKILAEQAKQYNEYSQISVQENETLDGR